MLLSAFCQYAPQMVWIETERLPVSSGPNKCRVCTAFSKNRDLHAVCPTILLAVAAEKRLCRHSQATLQMAPQSSLRNTQFLNLF